MGGIDRIDNDSGTEGEKKGEEKEERVCPGEASPGLLSLPAHRTARAGREYFEVRRTTAGIGRVGRGEAADVGCDGSKSRRRTGGRGGKGRTMRRDGGCGERSRSTEAVEAGGTSEFGRKRER